MCCPVLNSNIIQNGDILVSANPGTPGKWPLKRREAKEDNTTFWPHHVISTVIINDNVNECLIKNIKLMKQPEHKMYINQQPQNVDTSVPYNMSNNALDILLF